MRLLQLWSSLLLVLLAATTVRAESVTVSGQSYSYANTLDLSSRVDGRTLKLLYTLLADGSLSAALVADVSTSEYAGISFGRPHKAGVPTVIATTEFIDGYLLDGYDTDTCNGGKGQWPISNAALEYSNGRLTGVFTATGISAGSQTIGYTFGPFEGGILADHTRGSFSYSSFKASLDVSAAPASSAPTAASSNGTSTSITTTTKGPTTAATATRTKAPAASVKRSAVKSQSLSEWVSGTMANNWRLVVAFCVSWVAAPGVLLLLWPFMFDAAADACALLRLRPRIAAR